jgi:hypothetical protein
MRKRIIVASAIVGVTIAIGIFHGLNAKAQTLPGPAMNNGRAEWYVIIAKLERNSLNLPPTKGGQAYELLLGALAGQLPYSCVAGFGSLADTKDVTSFPYENLYTATVTKRIGPFDTDEAAIAALRKAGWDYRENTGIWTAKVGC